MASESFARALPICRVSHRPVKPWNPSLHGGWNDKLSLIFLQLPHLMVTPSNVSWFKSQFGGDPLPRV